VHKNPAKSRRRLVPACVVILSVLCIGGIVLAFHWPFSSQKVIQAIQEEWPGKIKVAQVHRTYFPHPGCVLENITLTRGLNPSGAPLVAIQKVTIEANYHDLLLRPGYVSRIVLEGLRIAIPVDQPEDATKPSEQTSKSSETSVRIGEVFTKNATLEIARKNNEPLQFEIHQLILKSISQNMPMSYDLAMRNAEPPGEIRSSGKLGPWDSAHLDNIPLSGSYTFDHADLGVFKGIAGMLSAKGEFHGALGRIETQGTTDTPNFEVTRSKHTVPLKTTFNAIVDGTGGNTILRAVDATFLRTAAHVEGSVSAKPGQHGKTTSLNITVRGGHIDDLLRFFVRESKPPIEGTTNFRAHVVWPPGHRPFVKKVIMEGDFDIEHAQWEKPARQMNVNILSKRASGNKNDTNTDDVTADVKGSVLLNEAIAKFRDVSFKVPGAEATMHGNYNVETTQIDFQGDLKTESTISNESTGAKALLLKPLDPLFKRKHAGAVVPVAMTGTYSDPHFGLALPGKK
jgi:hypothetical protein